MEEHLQNREPKVISLDFDGVIHSYLSGWKGAEVIPDPPVIGAMEAIIKYVACFSLCIYSSRSNKPGGITAMRNYIFKHLLSYFEAVGSDDPLGDTNAIIKRVRFPKSKPPASVTLDDRAFLFAGIFPSVDEIDEFVPWNHYLQARQKETA